MSTLAPATCSMCVAKMPATRPSMAKISAEAVGKNRELPSHGFLSGFSIYRVIANRWAVTRTPKG